MKKPLSGYVYVASVVGHPNLCKIGYTTKTPEERVSKLSREYKGFQFELYKSFRFERPKRNELMAHELLNAKRLYMELFSVTPIEGCIAVERTIGKHFKQLLDTESDFINATNAPWEMSGNTTKSFFNYITVNLSLRFKPEISFTQFQNIINTYMEIYDVRSAFDINEDLFIELCNEAGL